MDADSISSILGSSLDDAMGRVEPGPVHRSSKVTTVIITQHAEDGCRDLVRGYRHHRSFRMTLHGWLDHAVILVDAGDGHVYYNKAGKDVGRMISDLVGMSGN